MVRSSNHLNAKQHSCNGPDLQQHTTPRLYAAQAGNSAVLHQADLQGLMRLQTSDAVGCTRLLTAEGNIGCAGL